MPSLSFNARQGGDHLLRLRLRDLQLLLAMQIEFGGAFTMIRLPTLHMRQRPYGHLRLCLQDLRDMVYLPPMDRGSFEARL